MKKPSFCALNGFICRFATLQGQHHSIQNDTSEATYLCSIRNDVTWGESPICSKEDWKDLMPDQKVEELPFYSYKQYSYLITYHDGDQIGTCVEFPQFRYVEEGGCNVTCLVGIMELVENEIERMMQEKQKLPIPNSKKDPNPVLLSRGVNPHSNVMMSDEVSLYPAAPLDSDTLNRLGDRNK